MALLQRLNDQWRLEKCNHVIVPYKGEIGAAQFSYGPSDIWTADGSLSSIKFCRNVFNSEAKGPGGYVRYVFNVILIQKRTSLVKIMIYIYGLQMGASLTIVFHHGHPVLV